MTDEKIIKALECCINSEGCDCGNCPYNNNDDCQHRSGEDLLELIHRLQDENAGQKAEIERLSFYKTVFDKGLAVSLVNMQETIDKQKAEIERLTEVRDDFRQEVITLNNEKLELQKQVDELKDKIEQGKMIELPCKVGDTVYAVEQKPLRTHWDEHRYIVDEWDEWKVCELRFSLTRWECGGILGKDYYLTREEAEKRLKEVQNEHKL